MYSELGFRRTYCDADYKRIAHVDGGPDETYDRQECGRHDINIHEASLQVVTEERRYDVRNALGQTQQCERPRALYGWNTLQLHIESLQNI